MKLALNFVLFQLGWFSCVLGAANGMAWLGPVVVTGVIILHLVMALRPWLELQLILCAMALGLMTDSLLLATGWISYPAGSTFGFLAPYWIVAMWALFATTLNVSLSWLKNYALLALVLGAIGGPMSYLAGQKLGAMTFNEPIAALLGLSFAWAIAMPLLVLLANRFDGVKPNRGAGLTALPLQVSNHA